jgi:hypothetical protein
LAALKAAVSVLAAAEPAVSSVQPVMKRSVLTALWSLSRSGSYFLALGV